MARESTAISLSPTGAIRSFLNLIDPSPNRFVPTNPNVVLAMDPEAPFRLNSIVSNLGIPKLGDAVATSLDRMYKLESPAPGTLSLCGESAETKMLSKTYGGLAEELSGGAISAGTQYPLRLLLPDSLSPWAKEFSSRTGGEFNPPDIRREDTPPASGSYLVPNHDRGMHGRRVDYTPTSMRQGLTTAWVEILLPNFNAFLTRSHGRDYLFEARSYNGIVRDIGKRGSMLIPVTERNGSWIWPETADTLSRYVRKLTVFAGHFNVVTKYSDMLAENLRHIEVMGRMLGSMQTEVLEAPDLTFPDKALLNAQLVSFAQFGREDTNARLALKAGYYQALTDRSPLYALLCERKGLDLHTPRMVIAALEKQAKDAEQWQKQYFPLMQNVT